MPNDYYSDAAAPPAPAGEPKTTEAKEGDSDSQTAVIPLAVLGGKQFKPGEEVVLQIVSMNEDGAVVKYAEGKGEEEEPPKEEAPPPAAAPAPGGAPGGGGGPMSSMLG